MTPATWIEQIKAILKGTESFNREYTADNGAQHEILIRVIWDLEAYDVATDFSVLAKTWPNLDNVATLRSRQQSVMDQLDRIRSKKVHGLSEIDGYEVCASFKNTNGRNSITIIYTNKGVIDLERSKLLCMPSNQTEYKVPLTDAPELIQSMLTYIYTQFLEMVGKDSNRKVAASVEHLLEALLVMIETRLQLLESLTNGPANNTN